MNDRPEGARRKVLSSEMTATPEEVTALRLIAEAAKEIVDCPECMQGLHLAVADKLRNALAAGSMARRP